MFGDVGRKSQPMTTSNLVLIGMPAAGKTTVGKQLAARLRRPFIDTDRVLEERTGIDLAALMAAGGPEGFRQAEEQMLLGLTAAGSVIATGGSVVYSEPGMHALRALGPLIFLHCPVESLAARVGDPALRGMLVAPDQSFEALFSERLPLYRRYADIEISTAHCTPGQVVELIMARLACRPAPG